VGLVSIEERARLVGRALANFAPSYYVEPFGFVVIESLLYGTPVITTDMGAFSETNLHGTTGYRCRHQADFCQAVRDIEAGRISRHACREFAVRNYDEQVIIRKYDAYFRRIHQLYNGSGWTDADAPTYPQAWCRYYP
jgi:glycosyltransferase involved in cell wall biosynthesis